MIEHASNFMTTPQPPRSEDRIGWGLGVKGQANVAGELVIEIN